MGVDTEFFKSFDTVKEDYILYVGSIIKSKGVGTLVKSFEIIMKRKKNLKLLLVGDGNYAKQLKKIVKKLKLTDHVIFCGKKDRTELHNLYASAKLFVFPSFFEGFPTVISEALSMGLNCVTSDLPVFRELATKSEGFITLFKKGSAEDLADKIERALYRRHFTIH